MNDPSLTDWEALSPLDTAEPHQEWRRPRWFLLLIGLALGLTAGLAYTWGLNPVQFYNTDPVDLRPEHKETWILLVAAAYRQDGDLDRALGRLSGLDDPQLGQTVAGLTESYIQAGKSATRIRALTALADALGARTDDMLIYLATDTPTLPPPEALTPSATPSPIPTDTPTAVPATATVTSRPTRTATPTRTPTASPTPRPTLTRRPTPTLPPPFVLEERQRICEDGRDTPGIEIFVQTQEGAGIPGSEIWVTWSGGVDRFFTGLKPEIGLGYADFDMMPNETYAIAVGDPQLTVVSGLSAQPCSPGDDDSPLASWRVIIVATDSALTPTAAATATPATPTTPPVPTATSTSPPIQTQVAP